ncbi:unnamed protein product [Rotaria sp. Silwood1]|nr:unnamed protein product [Rotaria sp. Silwood1]CAF0928637.1 unnamed protein product [Rotaria sp. Silwood1]CAF4544321.1 unnamed protein product [Rotaria sp. Silwood1]CAF4618487.1 unnamed protein product [Rotaria sp. Silwood1]
MLNQEEIHRYFNHLSGAKRIEFLYGLLHLCQPLELRYLGTCLEEIARKDYEYLYHAEQKTNLLSTPTMSSSSTSSVSSNNEQNNQQTDLLTDEKLDLTDQFTRAHAIVDIALLWAKNRACAIRLFRRLKTSESVKLVDMLLERDDLDERTMDEILIIFCLASNHPAFSFDMRTQMSQIFKELEKRQRKMKLLQTVHNNFNDDDDDILDQSTCLSYHILSSSMHNSNTLSVHASPLLTRLAVVNFDTDSTSIRVLIRADWSDNNSTLTWKTPNDIRSFHLQLSNIVYHDDVRLERLMNISGYLRDIGSSTESNIELMKKNIEIYIAHLVYFSSYISTISTLAKFFNSSLKLVDSKQRLFNPNSTFDDSLSSSSSYSNGITPLQCEIPIQQQSDTDNKTLCSPKLSISINKSKQQLNVAKQARSIIPIHNGTQTGLEVRCEETQTDRMPGPGFILAEYQDFLRRYSMDELAKLTPNDLIVDGLDSTTANLLCSALDDLKPMSVHLSNSNKTIRSSSTFIQIPSSSSSPPLPPLLDAALMTVVQKQQQTSHISPPGSDRNQYEHILIKCGGVRPSSSSQSPKLPKTGTGTSGTNNNIPPPPPLPPPPPPLQLSSSSSSSNCTPQNQHHVPLLTAHSFLYNPIEPCIFPIAIPPGFPTTSPDFIRLFAPNMAAVAAAAAANTNNTSGASFVTNSNGPQGLVPNSRSTTQSNGTNTPSEQHGQNLHHPPPSTASTVSRHQQFNYRHKQHHSTDSHQFQQNSCHPYYHQQRQSQTTYLQQQQQQQHSRPKACYTCGDIGHLAFACPEQYLSDSNYSHNTRDGYKLDYRPRQSTPTNLHQQQRQMRSNSNTKTKLRDNS